MTELIRSPVPPFSEEDAIAKVRKAEDAWNRKDPEVVSMAYSNDSEWRNRAEFIKGRKQIIEFLKRKWNRELDYRLIKELWAYNDSHIAVRFAYEWHDDSNNWYRSYGNENWEFDEQGYMKKRYASINDLLITEQDRKLKWSTETRPEEYPGLTELGL